MVFCVIELTYTYTHTHIHTHTYIAAKRPTYLLIYSNSSNSNRHEVLAVLSSWHSDCERVHSAHLANGQRCQTAANFLDQANRHHPMEGRRLSRPDGWLHTEMVYLPAVTHSIINRAGLALSNSIDRDQPDNH